MHITLKKEWVVPDGNSPGTHTTIPAGRHEFERAPNPLISGGAQWLVLKGTLIGAAEGFWRQWKNEGVINNPEHPDHGKPINWGDMEVKIEE